MNPTLKSNFIERWAKYFPGAQAPIAFFYSDELCGSEPAKKFQGHRCMIAEFMRTATKGESFAFKADNIGCGGGRRYCGYSEQINPFFNHFLSYGIEGKVEGERYKKDPETVAELMKNVPMIDHSSKWLIVKPFDKIEENETPEGIIFFATPDVLSGLFTLAIYDRTDAYGVKTPFGPGCGSTIFYASKENLSEKPDCILGMFDPSARPYVPANTLSFTIPMKRFEQLVGYMDESFLITKTWHNVMKRMDN